MITIGVMTIPDQEAPDNDVFDDEDEETQEENNEASSRGLICVLVFTIPV